MKYIAAALALIMITGFAAAQTTQNLDVNTAIVASSANFPDALVSGAPADKLGIPVLLTDKNSLSESTRTTLQDMGVENVVIVGGPAVVSDNVQNTLEQDMGLSVRRLWGMTQIGTSVEVSNYFWSEGSQKATIVQYPLEGKNNYRLLSAVKNEVQGEDEPILVSDEGELSAKVLAEVERLGAKDVKVYSTNSVNVTNDLKAAGATNVEVETGDLARLEEQVRNRTRDRIHTQNRTNNTFVVVAASDFRHAISAPAVPNSNSYVVGSEDEIDSMLSYIQDAGVEEVKVTGNPDFAPQIASRIEDELGIDVQQVSGRPEDVAANFTRERQREWAHEQEQKYQHWNDQVNQAPGIRNAANQTVSRARNLVRNQTNVSEQVREQLREAERLYENGDYFAAKKKAMETVSERERERYRSMNDTERQERLQEDRESLNEARNKLRDMNSEFHGELQDAETVQERLKVIEKYREKKRQSPGRGEMDRSRERDMEDSNYTQEQDRDRNRTRDPESHDLAAGDANLDIESEGNTVKASMDYQARTAGYTMKKDFIQQNGQLQFVFKFTSPDGMAAQVLTMHQAEMERQVESGNYTVTATVMVDGKQVDTVSEDLTVTSGEQD